MLHKDLLEDIIKNLEVKRKKIYPETKNCIICNFIKEIEERYVNVVLEYINDIDFKEKFLVSEGLCVQHFKFLSILERYIDSCNFTKKQTS